MVGESVKGGGMVGAGAVASARNMKTKPTAANNAVKAPPNQMADGPNESLRIPPATGPTPVPKV